MLDTLGQFTLGNICYYTTFTEDIKLDFMTTQANDYRYIGNCKTYSKLLSFQCIYVWISANLANVVQQTYEWSKIIKGVYSV